LKCGRFLHILRFLYFTDNNAEIDRQADNYDRLWKIQTISDTLNDEYEKYYKPSEHLAVDKIIIKVKARVIFRQYVPKKHKLLESKYSNSVMQQATHDMKVYFGRNRTSADQDVTVTHATVRDLCKRIEGVGQKLYMDNFFSLPDLFDELATKTICCCWTVRQSQTYTRLGMKKGDIWVRVRGDLLLCHLQYFV
jgi:hypothetical protein